MLAATSPFANFSKSELKTIGQKTEHRKVETGEQLTRQGQFGTELIVVLKGTASVDISGTIVAELGAGEVIGEMSLLDHGPRTATVICESDCTLLLLSQRHFMAVLDDVPSMAHKLLASLAGRIRDLDRQYYG